MKAIKPKPGFNAASAFAAGILLLLSPIQEISAQTQASSFSVSGWTAGSVPVTGDSSSNLVSLSYGDSLTTIVAFDGNPNDGLGTDNDNVAYVNFSYTYTTYLTRMGESFSLASSIPVGTHTVSAYQSCSSGTVPPWSIGYDSQPAIDTDNLNMNITDGIGDCVPPGDYQVDIVLDSYAQSSNGPAPMPLQLQWSAYSGIGGLISLSPPSSANTANADLSPASSYLLSQLAFVRINRPASLPVLSLDMSAPAETSHFVYSATVAASYPGSCPLNPSTYLWSDGQTTATATGLTPGYYTVTVTAPCGATASASITIYDAGITDISEMTIRRSAPQATKADAQNPGTNTSDAGLRYHQADDDGRNSSANAPSIHFNPYPNPARHNVTFDLSPVSGQTCTLRILDLLGNTVLVPIDGQNIGSGNAQLQISLESLPAGIYLYEIVSGKTYSGKFVKQ